MRLDPRLTEADRLALAELYNEDRTAFAQVITDYIDPTYLTLDLAAAFMPTRRINLGEMHVRQFRGKYHVQQIVPGQITLGEQIIVRNEAYSYNLDILSAKAEYNTLELQNGGPAYTPEQIRTDVNNALNERLLLRGWNALANIWTAGNATALTISGSTYSNFTDVSGALTASALDAAIDHVNFWTPGVRSIIGTESALAPLSTFGQYKLIGSTTENYVTTNGQPANTFEVVSPYGGRYGVESYRGVSNIIRIPQIFDYSNNPPTPLLPTDFVLVIGEDVGEFITYGDAQTKEYIDNRPTPPYWNYETWVQFGMMVWNARGIVKLKVTSSTP